MNPIYLCYTVNHSGFAMRNLLHLDPVYLSVVVILCFCQTFLKNCSRNFNITIMWINTKETFALCYFEFRIESYDNLMQFSLYSGEDPLVEDHSERDINSVAGVLKLYFRGLENPLFPKERFQDLMSTISKYRRGHSNNVYQRDISSAACIWAVMTPVYISWMGARL